jgi:S1-C subfamily serine protease
VKQALWIGILLLASPLFARAANPEDSVVKVFPTLRYPNPVKPWMSSPPAEVFGSGTVIDGNRILTNAHLALYATEVQVQPRRGGNKVEAKVEMVAHDMDLAILSVKDPKFFEQCPPLPRTSKLPKVQDNVVVYGYPVGGNDLAVTKGVVSRIDFSIYPQGGHGLLVQVSAAINPGNSGGPALVGDKMIGVVFSRLREQQNIGYIIPNEEIDLFLDGQRAGKYAGKVVETANTTYQRCDNKGLRDFLKLDDNTHGLLIVPPRQRPAGYPFQEFDLLTKVGPYDLDNEGMVQLPDDLHVSFYAVIHKLVKDYAVPVTIIRKGQRIETAMPVSNANNRLIRDLRGSKPAYFIHGPLVFSPATLEGFSMYARMRPDLSPQSPLFLRSGDETRFPGEELVVVTSPLFQHKISKGYGEVLGQVVSEVNGTQVKNLKHLVALLRDCKDEFLTFRFADPGAEVLVFRRDEMEKVTEEILEDNGISPARRGSEEILKEWKQRKER